MFVKQGAAFVKGEESMIETQLHESIKQSNEYAFKLLSTPFIKNWSVNFHVVANLPSSVLAGKWKTQVS
nr:hypothetical protein [Candidatus Sigynarchaeota archaeon]